MITQLTDETFDTVVESTPLLLVDFYADWCGPCKQMEPVLNQINDDESNEISVAKVNVDLYPDLAAKWEIRSIPTMLVFHNGKPVQIMVGAKTRAYITSTINDRLNLNV